MSRDHLGSDFDDFLREEGLLEQAEAVATKRVLAYQISRAMEQQGMSKAAMARRMGTSRSSLDRLLDPNVPSVTLLTMERATSVLGKKVQLEMVKHDPGGSARSGSTDGSSGSDVVSICELGGTTSRCRQGPDAYTRLIEEGGPGAGSPGN